MHGCFSVFGLDPEAIFLCSQMDGKYVPWIKAGCHDHYNNWLPIFIQQSSTVLHPNLVCLLCVRGMSASCSLNSDETVGVVVSVYVSALYFMV